MSGRPQPSCSRGWSAAKRRSTMSCRNCRNHGPAEAGQRTLMSDDTRRILDLLAQGKISVDDAHRLIAAVTASDTATANASAASHSSGMNTDAPPKPPRYLRIAVHKGATDQRGEKDVNIRVPIAIVRGGMRLGAIIPGFGGERMQARL